MVIEDGLTLEDRRENLLPNKPLQTDGRIAEARHARHYRARPRLNGMALGASRGQ
ncbi:MAG: hypothetical protein ACHBNF_13915 [Chromatiales bacterium]